MTSVHSDKSVDTVGGGGVVGEEGGVFGGGEGAVGEVSLGAVFASEPPPPQAVEASTISSIDMALKMRMAFPIEGIARSLARRLLAHLPSLNVMDSPVTRLSLVKKLEPRHVPKKPFALRRSHQVFNTCYIAAFMQGFSFRIAAPAITAPENV